MRKILAVVLCCSFSFTCFADGDDRCAKAKSDFNKKAAVLMDGLERELSILKGTCKDLYKDDKDCNISATRRENVSLQTEVKLLEQRAVILCGLVK
jgi:hypothetical protein